MSGIGILSKQINQIGFVYSIIQFKSDDSIIKNNNTKSWKGQTIWRMTM